MSLHPAEIIEDKTRPLSSLNLNFVFLCVLCGSILFLRPRHHHIIAARIHFVLFQRSWWRSTDVLAAQVVLPVMTSAPNLFRIVAILHDALQVCAHGRECFELSLGGMDQDAWLVSEFENLS